MNKPINQIKLYGLNKIFNEIVNLFICKKLPNKILLSGSKGCGKATLAYHFINYVFSVNEKNPYDIKTNQTNIEETVKLGQKLFSDYIMVGTLQKLYTEEKTIKIKNSNNSVTTEKAFIEFSYRIIDVPTSQIMFSDDYTGIFDIEKKDMVSLEV